MDKFLITQAGVTKIVSELDDIRLRQLPSVVQDIVTAREYGDLRENAEYHAAREKQRFLEAKVAELEKILAKAEIFNPDSVNTSSVTFGTTITVLDLTTQKERIFSLVSEHESDLTLGLISIQSPFASAMANKSIGDVIAVGSKEFRILSISKYNGEI
jgi:transcription elongation factor GreA